MALQGVKATASRGNWRAVMMLCGYDRSRLAIALARTTSLCLRGDRDPTARASHPTWDNGAGFGLYRSYRTFPPSQHDTHFDIFSTFARCHSGIHFRSVSKNTFEQSNPKIAITRIIYHQLIYPLDAGNFEDWTHLEDTNKTKLLSCLAIVVQYHVKFRLLRL